MTLAGWIIASVAVAAGACVQGSVGFGFALVGAPVVALIDPGLVPGTMLLLAFVLTVAIARRERDSLDITGLGWALLGRVPGSVAGAAVVATLPPRQLALTFAVFMLAAALLSAARWRLAPTVPTLLAAGAASGLMGTASSIGGPPIALVYQHSPGAQLRATLAGYFTVSTVMSLALLGLVGELGRHQAEATLLLVPATVAGFLASRATAHRLDRGHTRVAVLVVSAGSALVLLVKEAWSLAI